MSWAKIENDHIIRMISWRFTEHGIECCGIKYLDLSDTDKDDERSDVLVLQED